jgi:hypothetical protein
VGGWGDLITCCAWNCCTSSQIRRFTCSCVMSDFSTSSNSVVSSGAGACTRQYPTRISCRVEGVGCGVSKANSGQLGWMQVKAQRLSSHTCRISVIRVTHTHTHMHICQCNLRLVVTVTHICEIRMLQRFCRRNAVCVQVASGVFGVESMI